MSRSPPTSIRVQLLSNGRCAVMLNESGAGSSRWRELAARRWREDSTSDGWGNFVLLRDVARGAEVAVASDHDAELRRVTITNDGDAAREIELTSYAEPVPGSATADAAHPAFSSVLAPIFSLRRRVIVAPGASARVAFWTLVAGTREAGLELGRLLGGAGAAEAAPISAAAPIPLAHDGDQHRVPIALGQGHS